MWSMDVSDDGSLVATGNDDGIVALWDIQNKTSMCLNFSKLVGGWRRRCMCVRLVCRGYKCIGDAWLVCPA